MWAINLEFKKDLTPAIDEYTPSLEFPNRLTLGLIAPSGLTIIGLTRVIHQVDGGDLAIIIWNRFFGVWWDDDPQPDEIQYRFWKFFGVVK